jgi:tripartite-type tricarboxylate transporter receptor subunit TctC
MAWVEQQIGMVPSLRQSMRRRDFITGITGLLPLAMVAADASAQTDYPNSPVRLISDSGPGGAINTGLRIIADAMSRYWKQQVVLVNQPGAAGSISATVASQAAPDGYTLYAPLSPCSSPCRGRRQTCR